MNGALRRLIAPALALLAGCGTRAAHPSGANVPRAAAVRVAAIDTELQYNAERPEYDALPLDDPARPARRAALRAWLLRQVDRALEGGHADEAFEQLKQALTLWDPAELSAPRDPDLARAAARVERFYRKRGAHEAVVTALAAQMSLGDDAGAATRYNLVIGWMRSSDADGAEARQRVIDDLEAAARVWPSPAVVSQLAALYLERSGVAPSYGGGRRVQRRGVDLRDFLRAGGSAAYDLARLYLRVSRPDDALQTLQKLKSASPVDDNVRALVEKYVAKTATPSDVVTMAMLFTQSGHDDRDVSERVCRDAERRFPQAIEPRLCTGQVAMSLDRLGVARRSFESAVAVDPGRREAWEQLARLYERHLYSLVSDENVDVARLEAALKQVEEFHAAAAKRFGAPLSPSMAGALFEVGRGYYNAGRIDDAIRYLERSLSTEPSPNALEQLGQIRLKRNEAREAARLFERAMTQPRGDREEQVYWRARMRRNLADAYEAAGERTAAENARKAALNDWEALLQLGLVPDILAEVGVERAKLLYQIGERDAALQAIAKAIDAAPDRATTYADVLAFLVPRGELEEALDAYHRALGRAEVTEYLKVYCSLWMVDLARRAKQPTDPLAAAYLQSMDGGKWYDDLARWATGRESEAVLLQRADTPAKRAEASFYRAMRAAGDGDLDSAKLLWRRVVETDMMAFFEYDMAQMFLRMGRAPTAPLLRSKPSSGYRGPSAKRPPDGSI